MSRSFARQTAIVGIGATEFSKDSGRSELQLAIESTMAALDDAGLTPADVDGMVTYTGDSNNEIEIARSIGTRISRGGRGSGNNAARRCSVMSRLAATRSRSRLSRSSRRSSAVSP